jgi:hypothetical protein
MIRVVVAGQVARQIPDGVGLAGSGRTVEQDALAGRLPELAQMRAARHEVQYVPIEQLQCGLGQDDVLALNRPQFMDHDALRSSAIIPVAVEREHLAAIATRVVDRVLQLGEATLHEFGALRAGGHGNLDPGPGLGAVFPVRGEHDGVAQVAGPAKP